MQMYVYIYIYICAYIYMYVCVRAYMYMFVYLYDDLYAHAKRRVGGTIETSSADETSLAQRRRVQGHPQGQWDSGQ